MLSRLPDKTLQRRPQSLTKGFKHTMEHAATDRFKWHCGIDEGAAEEKSICEATKSTGNKTPEYVGLYLLIHLNKLEFVFCDLTNISMR